MLLLRSDLMAKLNTKLDKKKEPIVVGPCSANQELVFKRANEVDWMIIGGSRG